MGGHSRIDIRQIRPIGLHSIDYTTASLSSNCDRGLTNICYTAKTTCAKGRLKIRCGFILYLPTPVCATKVLT